jgi:hypothetical protein
MENINIIVQLISYLITCTLNNPETDKKVSTNKKKEGTKICKHNTKQVSLSSRSNPVQFLFIYMLTQQPKGHNNSIQFNYLCAEPTATKPITDTAHVDIGNYIKENTT